MNTYNRAIRLFVSSTFSDMHEERDALCRFVFPYLEDYCSRRNVGFTGIDLRWGVTDEEVRDGKTVALCLAEIDNCRPYFLGMLGERYGWVPEKELTAGYEALFGDGCSITEAEIEYGALNEAYNETTRAVFCLRSRKLTNRIAGAAVEDAQTQKRMLALKERIRQSQFPVLDGYTSIEEFCAFIRKQLCAAIDADFPQDEALDEYKSEAVAHIGYALNQNEIFAGRDSELDYIDSCMATDPDRPVFITGAAGTGKTAFLARWAIRRQEAHSDEFVFVHFYGASVRSDRWENLVKRLIYGLCRKFGLELRLPDTQGELVVALSDYLHLATSKGHAVVIVLDGVDLITADKTFGLAWLPRELPQGVRMLLSVKTASGRANMLRRNYRELRLRLLTSAEQQALVATHLAPYGKKIEPCYLERILRAKSAQNPLYLRVLLHELCTLATHDRMDELLTVLLEAENPCELFKKVIERCQEIYDAEGSNMTREALSLVRCARHGLTEGELLSMLEVPQAEFSPLYLALKPYLINRNGLLNFAYNALGDAVQQMFLTDKKAKLAVRKRLINCFINRQSPHAVEELAWLLDKTNDRRKLREALCDLSKFHILWCNNPSEVKMYWEKIEAKTRNGRDEAYSLDASLLRRAPKQTLFELATFLFETGSIATAKDLLTYLVKICPSLDNREIRLRVFGLLGDINHLSGNRSEAQTLYKRKIALCEKAGNRLELSRALGCLGLTEDVAGNYAEALKYYEQAAAECRRMGFIHGIQVALGNLGNIFIKQNEYDKALAMFVEQEQVCRESGHLPGLVAALGNRGVVMLNHIKDYSEALRLFDEQEKICRRIGDREKLQVILGNRAVALYNMGKKTLSRDLLEQKLALCEQLNHFEGQQMALANLVEYYLDANETDKAIELSVRLQSLCRKYKARMQYAQALRQYAIALKACGRDEEAKEAMRQAQIID
ncbi:MAG: DUF4062 domain-containing protein [Tannerella sp.]|jgi:tetratricopeptide (TPR) repeat protein|nr:DUF4062 domain-containing protein [Tannerella sp.]